MLRLTLRTLLAYLDDTLEPAQVKAIGQKVAESDPAQDLIARIKQVTRRRRITAPPTTGPGGKFDPNTVAEYLDNALNEEQLGEVEKLCLESDVHLAEIAACHQILTLVLGQPALVPPTAKQRMYGLVQGRESIPYRKATAPSHVGAGDVSASADVLDVDDGDLPFAGKSGGWLRVGLPAALVLVLAGGVAVWMALPDEKDAQPIALRTGGVEEAPKPRSPGKGDGNGAVERPSGTAPEKGSAAPAKGEPAKGPEEPAKGPPEAPGKGPTEKPAGPAAPSSERRALGTAAGAEGQPSMLLRQAPGANTWQRLRPAKDLVNARDPLVSLPGFRSEVRLDAGVGLTLWGSLFEQLPLFTTPLLESAVTLYAPGPDGAAPAPDVDLSLERGRVVLVNRKPNGPARVRVRFHQEVWDVTLAEPETTVGVELFGVYTQEMGYRPDEAPLASANLMVLKGQAALRRNFQDYPNLSADGTPLVSWDNKGRGLTAPRAADELALFTWEVKPPAGAGADALKARREEAARAVQELAARLSGATDPEDALTEVLQGANASIPVLHRTTALFGLGALDALPKLLDALGDEKHREVRLATNFALRHFIGRHPENTRKLEEVLTRKYNSEAEAKMVLLLLHHFSREELGQAETYATLIELLRHRRLAVRELASWHLGGLVPQAAAKIAYDPAGGAEQFDRAIEEWKKVIPDGKLPPAAPGR